MAELTGDDTGAFSTARRFQAMSLFVAGMAFALLLVQGTDIWGALFGLAASYGFGVLCFLTVCLLVHFITLRMRDRGKGSSDEIDDPMVWYRTYFMRFRLADILCALVALICTISSFSVYKAKVVGAQGYLFDDLFTAWDRALFGGRDPWEISHALLPSAAITKWIDIFYHPAFLPMLIGFLVCMTAQARPALRYTYMLSYLASFVIIGMVMANALSSAGPVFDGALFGDGATFGPLIEKLAMQDEVAGPFSAVFAQDYLLRLNEAGVAGLGGGISAMPSMHIVLASLWAFAGWHINRTLGLIATLYAAMIWVGSVHLGWHYFVDGLVGLVALAIIWAVCGWTMGLYGKAQVIRATT